MNESLKIYYTWQHIFIGIFIIVSLILCLFLEVRGYDLLTGLWMNTSKKILTEIKPSLTQVIHELTFG